VWWGGVVGVVRGAPPPPTTPHPQTPNPQSPILNNIFFYLIIKFLLINKYNYFLFKNKNIYPNKWSKNI